jgi:RimJ/RimL family protein N-acetyltransferase
MQAQPMDFDVRAMTLDEVEHIIDYFHSAAPEHLEMMGVDPTRLPSRSAWRDRYQRELTLPPAERSALMVIWLEGERCVGFSTADKITFGEQANMHLHIIEPGGRGQGAGVECVRRSASFYFETLKLKRLFSEPNAFNIAPNRTLQKAGFKYVKTHMTVPGPLNFHQAVTKWVLEA